MTSSVSDPFHRHQGIGKIRIRLAEQVNSGMEGQQHPLSLGVLGR
jgi:hypothetical protein